MIDYIGVDYGGAVSQGKIANRGEYEEMQDFAQGIAQQVKALADSDHKARLLEQSQRLIKLIEQKAEAHDVRALTTAMRLAIIDNYKVTVVPRTVPQLERGAQLYTTHCAGCHGASGDGQGPLAAGMQPPPVDFLDKARYARRTLYGLYNTITQGVPGTAMTAFHELSVEDRWALAFYVGGMLQVML